MQVDGYLNQLGDLLHQFFPDDHSRGPAWHQSPYVDDLGALLRLLRSGGASAKEIGDYIYGPWMITRPVPTTDEKQQLEAIHTFIEDWFRRHAVG